MRKFFVLFVACMAVFFTIPSVSLAAAFLEMQLEVHSDECYVGNESDRLVSITVKRTDGISLATETITFPLVSSLPPGCRFVHDGKSANATIAGKPTVAGTFPINIMARATIEGKTYMASKMGNMVIKKAQDNTQPKAQLPTPQIPTPTSPDNNTTNDNSLSNLADRFQQLVKSNDKTVNRNNSNTNNNTTLLSKDYPNAYDWLQNNGVSTNNGNDNNGNNGNTSSSGSGGGCNSFSVLAIILAAVLTLKKSRR